MQQPYNPDNPPAFPQAGFDGPFSQVGMSLRDYFAAQALPAVLADFLTRDASKLPPGISEQELLGGACYQAADALLATRQKGGSDAR